MRRRGIDALKASAIVTVVWIHAAGSPLDLAHTVPLEAVLTSWAVPAFFFAAGFLHATPRRVDLATVLRWTLRLGVPYAIASVLALAARRGVLGERLTAGDALFALVTGSAWGIYYFVPVLLGAELAAALLSRLLADRPRAARGWWAIAIASSLLGMLGTTPHDPVLQHLGVFWLLRSPGLWWGYVFLGWAVAHATWGRWLDGRRTVVVVVVSLLVWTVVLATCVGTDRCQAVSGPVIWVTNHCWIAVLVLVGERLSRVRVIEWLSNATYPIYLYHFFITEPVRHQGLWSTRFASTQAFAAALVGTVLLVFLTRALFGARARVFIG